VTFRDGAEDPDKLLPSIDLFEDDDGIRAPGDGPAGGDRDRFPRSKRSRERLLGKDLAHDPKLGRVGAGRPVGVPAAERIAVPRGPSEARDRHGRPDASGEDTLERPLDAHLFDTVDRPRRGEQSSTGHVDRYEVAERMHLHRTALPPTLDPPSGTAGTGRKAASEGLSGEPRRVESSAEGVACPDERSDPGMTGRRHVERARARER